MSKSLGGRVTDEILGSGEMLKRYTAFEGESAVSLEGICSEMISGDSEDSLTFR
jgi:hypothetical protein